MPYTTETVEYIESVRRTWFERLFTRPWDPLRSHRLERRTKVVRNYAPLKAAPLAANPPAPAPAVRPSRRQEAWITSPGPEPEPLDAQVMLDLAALAGQSARAATEDPPPFESGGGGDFGGGGASASWDSDSSSSDSGSSSSDSGSSDSCGGGD